ncbi:MAG TPA: hypothetical protein VFA60_11145 [Terriglobales bacterium]|nr:hypothetical protein [Terriglobales bacterium]
MQSGLKLAVGAWAALGLAMAVPAPDLSIRSPRMLAGIAYVEAMLGQPESAAQWMERARHADDAAAGQQSAQQVANPAPGAQASGAVTTCRREPARVAAPVKQLPHISVPEPALAYAATVLPAALHIDGSQLASLKYIPVKTRFMSRSQIDSLIRAERRSWRLQYRMAVPRAPRPPATPIS